MWIKREEWKHSNETRVKKDRVSLGPISPSIHLHNPGFVWDSEWWDIWHSPCVMIFTEACLRLWTEWKCRCAKDLCVLFWRSLFSRVAFALKLHADLMKVFVVFSLLNCQGFLDMENRVCGYFVCVVRCVCVQFFKKLQLPFVVQQWSAVQWDGHRQMDREQEPCLVSANAEPGMICYQGSG